MAFVLFRRGLDFAADRVMGRRWQIDRATRWLVALAVVHLAAGLALIGVQVLRDASLHDAALRTAVGRSIRMAGSISDDSWGPMLVAYQSHAENPAGGLYRHFFEGAEKFQYPPPSLLVLDAFPASRTLEVEPGDSSAIRRIVIWFSRGAVALTILSAWLLFEWIWQSRASPSGGRGALIGRGLLALVLGVTFHPLVSAHAHGQVQVFINLGLALAGLAIAWRRDVLAGICVGLCCIFKPHFGLILVWALFRRRWALAGAIGGVTVVGGLLAIAKFGLRPHLRYLEVVSTLSRRGEAYWPNQSMNGFLNRLLGNGDPVTFSASVLPPFHPWIYAATLITALVLLAAAFWPRRSESSRVGGVVDYFAVLTAVTIASPVAWTHHYGAMLPVFAVLFALVAGGRSLPGWTAPTLAAAYLAVANIFVFPDLIERHPFIGVLFSHTYFGGCLAFGLLTYLRVRGRAYDGAFAAEPGERTEVPVLGPQQPA